MIVALLALAVLALLPKVLAHYRVERMSHREQFDHYAGRIEAAAEETGRGDEARRYLDAQRAAAFRGE